MELNSLRGVRICGTGSYLPPNILTNAELEGLVDTNDEWIRSRTGISQRHIAHKEIATSDLATGAALNALQAAGLEATDIDMIIVATATPDMVFPSTACLVQKNIGAGHCAAFDLEAACTGFNYALNIGAQFIRTGFYNRVMVIGAETFSRIVDWKDRNTCILFGDGAGAVIIEPCEQGKGIIASIMKADGTGGDLLYVPGGGSKYPSNLESVEKRMHFIKMNGNDVYKFAVRVIGDVVIEALESCGLSPADIDVLIPHQANMRIIEAARKKLNLTEDKVIITINKYGNMSAASIPVALDETVKLGKIQKGNIVAIVGFGAGLTWGANIIRWE